MKWLKPAIQRLYTGDGSVVLLKLSMVADVDRDKVTAWTAAENRFEPNRITYEAKSSRNTYVVAGILHAFIANKFHYSEVIEWLAWCGIDLSEQDVSNALVQLQKSKHKPVRNFTGKGSGARWAANQEGLRKFLGFGT